MNFVADESGRLVDEVDPIAETVSEIDLVPRGYWNAISDDNRLVTTIIVLPLKRDCWPWREESSS